MAGNHIFGNLKHHKIIICTLCPGFRVVSLLTYWLFKDTVDRNPTPIIIPDSNMVELPPLRFVKETSKAEKVNMEAVVIDIDEQGADSIENVFARVIAGKTA